MLFLIDCAFERVPYKTIAKVDDLFQLIRERIPRKKKSSRAFKSIFLYKYLFAEASSGNSAGDTQNVILRERPVAEIGSS